MTDGPPAIAFMVLWPRGDLVLLAVNRSLAQAEDICRMIAGLHDTYPQRTIAVSYLAEAAPLETEP